jgi:hypothetical protein
MSSHHKKSSLREQQIQSGRQKLLQQNMELSKAHDEVKTNIEEGIRTELDKIADDSTDIDSVISKLEKMKEEVKEEVLDQSLFKKEIDETRIKTEYNIRHSIDNEEKSKKIKRVLDKIAPVSSNSAWMPSMPSMPSMFIPSPKPLTTDIIKQSTRLVAIIDGKDDTNLESRIEYMKKDAKIFEASESYLKQTGKVDEITKTELLKRAVSERNIGMIRLLIKHGAKLDKPKDVVSKVKSENGMNGNIEEWLLANLPASTGGKSRSNRNLKKSRNSVKHKVSRKRKYKVRRTRSKSH